MKSKGAVWIDQTILESPYCIGLCQTEKQYRNELKRLKIPDSTQWIEEGKDANVVEATDGETTLFIVSIRPTKESKYIDVVCLLLHEAVHIWQKICKDMNEDAPGSEIEAYAIQRIALNLIKAYKSK